MKVEWGLWIPVGLLLTLSVCFGVLVYDTGSSNPMYEAEVTVVDKLYSSPGHSSNNLLVVNWGGRLVQVRCSRWQWKAAKSGERLIAEERRSPIFGISKFPNIKEDD
jgi:hypothetical protein